MMTIFLRRCPSIERGSVDPESPIAETMEARMALQRSSQTQVHDCSNAARSWRKEMTGDGVNDARTKRVDIESP